MINLHIKAEELKRKLDLKDGLPGRDGIDGKDGKPGKDGKDGFNGIDGKDGLPGRDGLDGLNGKDGKDGSPDTAEQVRDKLETLDGEDRLDAKAIKNLPKIVDDKIKVGGIRFLENLADVSVPITDKRQDVLIQYDTTDKRWKSGIALTVSASAPTSPKINDLWLDIS